eukprot:scaffold19864_cov48-Phaeocystis_antarctica.AAC.1
MAEAKVEATAVVKVAVTVVEARAAEATAAATEVAARAKAVAMAAAERAAVATAVAMEAAKAGAVTEAVATAAAMAEEAKAAVAKAVATAAAVTEAATAVSRTPRPHSSARRVALCWRSTGTPRCHRPVLPSGSLLLASAVFQLLVATAAAAQAVVKGRVITETGVAGAKARAIPER